jgi:LysM repeat protein
MNTPNPLVPQGSLLEQKAKSKPNLPMIVFVLVAIHVVIFGGMLMSGCKRDATKDAGATNSAPGLQPMAADTNTSPATAPGAATAPVAAPPVPNAAPTPTTMPPAATTTTTAPSSDTPKKYTVVKGDSFSKIAGKYGVSVSALESANPGIDPKKLQVGKDLVIPAAEAKVATMTSTDTNSGDVYVVKSGDALEKIAKAHGTTVKALEELNGLTTSKIKVGQKLKIPAGSKPATADTAATTASPTTAAPGTTK